MDKKTVYLAGPITGMPDLNVQVFNEFQEIWEEEGYDVLNPHVFSPYSPVIPYETYIRRGINHLMGSDLVAVLPDWEGSAGARLEVHIATVLGIPVYLASYPDDLEKGRVTFSLDFAGKPTNPAGRFEELLAKMADLHNRKRSDYTGASGDILHNYRTSAKLAGISTAAGMFARMCEKIVRISSIYGKGGNIKVTDETVNDTFFDLAIMSLLAIIEAEERAPGRLVTPEMSKQLMIDMFGLDNPYESVHVG